MEQSRSWFRIHLSTALIAMLAASAILGVNLARETVVEVHKYEYTTLTVSAIGFPFTMRSKRAISDLTGSRGITMQAVTLGEIRPGVPRMFHLPSDLFCRDEETARMEIESYPDITYTWRSMDRQSLIIPEENAGKPRLNFYPTYPGDYVFGCRCTDAEKNSVLLKTTLHVSTRQVKSVDGWILPGAFWNAAVGLAFVIALMVLVEWRLRRRA